MSGLTWPVLGLLALLGLVGGVGITALGPGGVLPTIGLFALTGLAPAEIAGTAIVTHIATGTLATAAYRRSGQLREPETRRTALVLAATAVLGTPLGVLVNTGVSVQAFGIVLGVVVALVAGLVWHREHHRSTATRAHPPAPLLVALGLIVSMVSGIVGIGGPMLTVPLLVALAVPALEALAAAQVQSIVIATVGTIGYLVHGTIDWPLAAVVGLPELAGVLLGWRIAHALPARRLKDAMVIALLALAPYLILHG
jgi:uncharacterized membrane protein YfcA